MGKTFKATVDWLGMVENGGVLPGQDVDPSVNGGKAQKGVEVPLSWSTPKERDGIVLNPIRRFKDNISENIHPFTYSNTLEQVWNAGILGKPTPHRDPSMSWHQDYSDYQTRVDPQRDERIDLLQMLMGRDQINNSIKEAIYKPTTSKDKNAKYYRSEKTEASIIRDIYKANKLPYPPQKGYPSGDVNVIDLINEIPSEKGKSKQVHNNILNTYSLSRGEDDKGSYIAYYDNWDVNPYKHISENLGNLSDWFTEDILKLTPPEIYGRVYYNKKTGKLLPKKALGGPSAIPHDDVMTGHMATDYQEDYQAGYQDHYTAEYGVNAQAGTEIIQGGMLPEIEVSALTDDSYNTLSDPQQKVYDMYVNKYGTRQTIPTGKNTAMHWKDALRMVEEQGLKTLSHESDPIFNTLFNRGSVESAEAGNFTPHANTIFNKITIPDYKAQDYSSFDSFTFLDGWHSIDELEKIDIEKIKNAKTDNDLDKFSDLEWKVFKKYKKSYTYGHEEQVKSGEKDFTYLEWDQRYNDDMLYGYIPDDVDLQEMINNKIDKHERYVADIPGNKGIDDVIAEVAHLTESNRTGSKVDLAISLLRDWQRIKKMPYKKFISHFKPFEGWENDPNMKGKPLPKSWSSLWDHIDSARYSDPKHYEYITHQIIEPWLRKEYDYNPTGVKKDNPMPKSKYDLFKDGGSLPKAQMGNFPLGIKGQGFSNIQVPGINWAEGVPELTGTEARQGVNVSGLNLAKDFNLTDNLKLSLSNPAFVYARPTLDNMPVSDGGTFKGFPFEPRIGLTYNFRDGGSLPKAQDGTEKKDDSPWEQGRDRFKNWWERKTKEWSNDDTDMPWINSGPIVGCTDPKALNYCSECVSLDNASKHQQNYLSTTREGGKNKNFEQERICIYKKDLEGSNISEKLRWYRDFDEKSYEDVNWDDYIEVKEILDEKLRQLDYSFNAGGWTHDGYYAGRDKKILDRDIEFLKLKLGVTDPPEVISWDYMADRKKAEVPVPVRKEKELLKIPHVQLQPLPVNIDEPVLPKALPYGLYNDLRYTTEMRGKRGGRYIKGDDGVSEINLRDQAGRLIWSGTQTEFKEKYGEHLKRGTGKKIESGDLTNFHPYITNKNFFYPTGYQMQDGAEINERDRFVNFIKENEGGHDYIRAKNSAIKKMGEDGEWDGESYYKIFEEDTQTYYPYFLKDEGGATIGHGHHNDDVYETYKDGITIEKAEELLNTDVNNKMDDTEIWWTSKYGDGEWDKLDESTQYMLGDMAYNTGHIRNYKLFADAIKRGDFKAAEENYSRGTSEGGPRLGRNETYMAEYLKPWMDIQKEKIAVAPPLNKMPLPIGVYPTDIEGNAHSMTEKYYPPVDFQIPPAVQDNTRVGTNIFGGWRDGGQLPKSQDGTETKPPSTYVDRYGDTVETDIYNTEIRPENQTEYDEVNRMLFEYMQTPEYLKRLKEQGYKDPQKTQQLRFDAFKNSSVVEKEGHTTNSIWELTMTMPACGRNEDGLVEWEDMTEECMKEMDAWRYKWDHSGSYTDPTIGQIEMDLQQLDENNWGAGITYAHEMGHNVGGYFNNYSNPLSEEDRYAKSLSFMDDSLLSTLNRDWRDAPWRSVWDGDRKETEFAWQGPFDGRRDQTIGEQAYHGSYYYPNEVNTVYDFDTIDYQNVWDPETNSYILPENLYARGPKSEFTKEPYEGKINPRFKEYLELQTKIKLLKDKYPEGNWHKDQEIKKLLDESWKMRTSMDKEEIPGQTHIVPNRKSGATHAIGSPESYGDLYGLRYFAHQNLKNEDGSAWTPDQEFTQDHWGQLIDKYKADKKDGKENLIMQRMIRRYKKQLEDGSYDTPDNGENIIEIMNRVATEEEGMPLGMSKYGGQHNWALDLRPTAQAGKEVKSDDIYENDKYSQSASKYKKMLPKYQDGIPLRSDATNVYQHNPNIEIAKREKYVDRFGSTSGSHFPSGPEKTLWEKIKNAGANPMGTFGYSVRNERIPWGYIPRGATHARGNAFDTFVGGIVNPFSWLESAEYSYDAFKKGDVLGGITEGISVLPVIPASVGAARKLLPRYGGSGLKTSTTHTYNPKTKGWIENNAPKVKQKLLANDVDYFAKQEYLTNKITKLQQGKIKITEEIKQFKINNPGKPVPKDLTKVDDIVNRQLEGYTDQLNNVPPTYTEPGPGGPFGRNYDHLLDMDEAGNFNNNLFEDLLSGKTPPKTWTGPTLREGNDNIIKGLSAELKLAEEMDLKRLVGDYKWDNRNIFQKYFNTPEPPWNMNNLYESPYYLHLEK